MNEVSLLDRNFKTIIDYLDKKQVSPLELSKSLQEFRKSVCLDWYSQFLQYDHISYLTAIWNALFELVTSDDPGIRISTFSTIGALLFVLCPFIPRTTVISFLSAVQNKSPSPHLSIAIVACFCHISKYVSPLDTESILSRLPIVQHLGEELSDYLKYLPKIFSSMKPIDTEFQRSLLRTMLITFGEEPTIDFILSVIELVKHEPEIMIPDLLQYINNKSLQLTMLMVSPLLLQEPKMRHFFDDKSKDELFELALSKISSAKGNDEIVNDKKNKRDENEINENKNKENETETETEIETEIETENENENMENKSKSKNKENETGTENGTESGNQENENKVKGYFPNNKNNNYNSPNNNSSPNFTSFTEFEEACGTLSALLEISPKDQIPEKMKIIKKHLSSTKKLPQHLVLFTFPLADSIETLTPLDSDTASIKTAKLIALSKFLIREPNEDNIISVLSIFNNYLMLENQHGEIFSKLVDAISKSFSVITIKTLSNKIIFEKLQKIFMFIININTTNWVHNIALLKMIQSIDLEVGELLSPPNYEEKMIKLIYNFCFSRQNPLNNVAISTLTSVIRHSTTTTLLFLLLEKADFYDNFSILKTCQILNEVIDVVGNDTFKCLEGPITEALILNHHSIHTSCEAMKFLNKIKSSYLQNEMKLVCFDLVGRIFKSFTGIDPHLPTTSEYQLNPLQSITTLVETDILSRPFDDQTYYMDTIRECLVFINRNLIVDNNLSELSIRLVKLFPEESFQILMRKTKSGGNTFVDTNSFYVLTSDIVQSTPSVSVVSRCAAAVCLQAEKTSTTMVRVINEFNNKKLIKNGRDKYNFLLYLQSLDKVNLPEIQLSHKDEILYQFLANNNKVDFVNNTSFSDWPLEDEGFLSFVEENKKIITNIKISHSETLTKKLIRFISQNIEMFEQSSTIDFIKKEYFTSYKKLFIDSNIFKLKSFSKVSRLPSITPLIYLQSFSENDLSIFLIKNFFKFHKLNQNEKQISDKVFNQLFEKLIKENEIEDYVLYFAIDNRILIDDNNVELLLKCTQKFVPIIKKYFSSLKIDPINKINNMLNYIQDKYHINEDEITISSLTKYNTVINASIETDPLKYFKIFIKKFTFKSRNSKGLIYFLSRFEIPHKAFADFLTKEIMNISCVSTVKQLLYFFRLIELFLAKIFDICTDSTQSTTSKIDPSFMADLLNALTISLPFLSKSTYASVHREVGAIYAMIPLFIRPDVKIIEHINLSTSLFRGCSSLYFVSSAICTSMNRSQPCNNIHNNNNEINNNSNISPNCLTNDHLISSIRSNIPSEILRVLKTVLVFSRPSRLILLNNYYYSMYAIIIDVYKLFHGNPLIDQNIENIISEFSYYKEFFVFQKLIFNDLLYYAKPKNDEKIISIIEGKRIEPTKLFAQNPNLSNGLKMLGASDCPKAIECAMMIAGKAAVKPCLLAALVLIYKIIKKVGEGGEEEIESITQVISTMIESLQMGERGNTLKKMLSLNHDEVWNAALKAAQIE